MEKAIDFLKRLHPISGSLEAELRKGFLLSKRKKLNSCFLKARYATMPGTCKRDLYSVIITEMNAKRPHGLREEMIMLTESILNLITITLANRAAAPSE